MFVLGEGRRARGAKRRGLWAGLGLIEMSASHKARPNGHNLNISFQDSILICFSLLRWVNNLPTSKCVHSFPLKICICAIQNVGKVFEADNMPQLPICVFWDQCCSAKQCSRPEQQRRGGRLRLDIFNYTL